MFWDALPQYLSFGMTNDEYWCGDPQLAIAYRKKYYIETERKNYFAWISGAYVYDAVSVALANGFRDKGRKVEKYLAEPIKILPPTIAEEKERAEKEKEKAIAMLNKWKENWDNTH